jgi:hypothetical protein
MGMLADLIAANRKLIEASLSRLQKIEETIGSIERGAYAEPRREAKDNLLRKKAG